MAAPAAAATIPVVAAGKQLAQTSAGLIQAIEQFMAKPLWSDQHVTTVTHEARNHDMVTRTKTHGFALSNGMVLGILLVIALWEMVNSIGDVFGDATGAIAEGGGLLGSLCTPINWAMTALNITNPTTGESTTVNVATPPTFMSAINQPGVQMMLPFLAAGQQFGQQGTVAVAKYLTPKQ